MYQKNARYDFLRLFDIGEGEEIKKGRVSLICWNMNVIYEITFISLIKIMNVMLLFVSERDTAFVKTVRC